MNTSMSWIKMYVPDLDVTAQEYTDAMTLSGTKVEGFEKLDADLDKIVIGQIEKIEKHPDADKLIICQVIRVDSTRCRLPHAGRKTRQNYRNYRRWCRGIPC